MLQTSCSELLVDTHIDDPEKALGHFIVLFRDMGWEASPPLSLLALERVKGEWLEYNKDMDGDTPRPEEMFVYDAKGNYAWLEYGGNGYIETGFRLDSHCNDYDHNCYPLFRAAIDQLGAELIACDGGSKGAYDEWLDKQEA